MAYTIDLENRRIIINNETKSQVIINEFDRLKRKFLPNTQDIYECELVLLEVDIYNEDYDVAGKEIRAFARRIGNPNWLMEFIETEYSF